MVRKFSNGWKLAKSSLALLNNNRSLLIFPLLSGVAVIAILASFFGGAGFFFGDEISSVIESEGSNDGILGLAAVFMFYLIAYFCVTFFNAALIHCSVKIMKGEETSVTDGIQFASTKLGKILGWSILSATIGTILQIIQQTGKIGEIVSSLMGMAWSVVTFFVVPVLVYQDLGVVGSIKESTKIMKAKWGESLSGNFSFGLIYVLGLFLAVMLGVFLGPMMPGISGWIIPALLMVTTVLVFSAAKTVLVAAVYNHTNDISTGEYNSDLLDDMFVKG